MERQNVTLSIPKDILRRAKILAIERNTSLSGLMTQLLTETVAGEDRYRAARERFLARQERGLDLGTRGHIPWRREELHER